MTPRSRPWRAAEWLGLVTDRPKPPVPVAFWVFGVVVVAVCVGVIALLR